MRQIASLVTNKTKLMTFYYFVCIKCFACVCLCTMSVQCQQKPQEYCVSRDLGHMVVSHHAGCWGLDLSPPQEDLLLAHAFNHQGTFQTLSNTTFLKEELKFIQSSQYFSVVFGPSGTISFVQPPHWVMLLECVKIYLPTTKMPELTQDAEILLTLSLPWNSLCSALVTCQLAFEIFLELRL